MKNRSLFITNSAAVVSDARFSKTVCLKGDQPAVIDEESLVRRSFIGLKPSVAGVKPDRAGIEGIFEVC